MCLAIPGKIADEEMLGNNRIVPEAHTGDFVLVHVGFAISKVDEEEADRAYKLSIFTFLAATGAHGELRHGVFGRS